MRRLLGWTGGVVGIAALARALARRRGRNEPPPAAREPAVDERAEALRRKLSETRVSEQAQAPAPVTEEPGVADTAAAEEPSETIEERRARVHAKAQEAIDAMQEPLE